jgi:hypothetical protein
MAVSVALAESRALQATNRLVSIGALADRTGHLLQRQPRSQQVLQK